MNRRDEIILRKVLSELDVARIMLNGSSLQNFLYNEMLKRAVCMTVINVGELVKNLTEECRLSHPEVAWKKSPGSGILLHTSIRHCAWKTFTKRP